MEEDVVLVHCVHAGHAATMQLVGESEWDAAGGYCVQTYECEVCHFKVDVALRHDKVT